MYIMKTQDNETTKKPFNRKKWREKKYSKQFKVKQWEERRQKAVLRTYFKQLKKQGGNTAIDPNGNRKFENKKKTNSYLAAKLEYERLQVEKRQQVEENKRKKEEIKEAIEKYRQNKAEKFKILSRKTHWGQPKMKERMKLLLEKIEKNVSNY